MEGFQVAQQGCQVFPAHHIRRGQVLPKQGVCPVNSNGVTARSLDWHQMVGRAAGMCPELIPKTKP